MELHLRRLVQTDEIATHVFFPMLAYAAATQCRQHEADSSLALRIPDTVLYSYSKPIVWYYYDESDCTIRKRPKRDLQSRTIVEAFSSASPASVAGVHAWFVAPPPSTPTSAHPNCEFCVTPQVVSGRDGLLQFLQVPKEKGVLQRYFDARAEGDGETYSTAILCTYTPLSFSVEKLRNRCRTDDPTSNIPLADRCTLSTEGSRCVHEPVMSIAVAARFLSLCQEIGRLLQSALGYHVSQLSLWCRVDPSDRVFILWCSEIKLTCASRWPDTIFTSNCNGTRQRVGGASQVTHVSSLFLQSSASNGTTAIIPKKQNVSMAISSVEEQLSVSQPNLRMCPLCQERFSVELMPRVQKRWVLFALSLLDRNVEGWADCVPPSVSLIHPDITREEFFANRKKASWLTELVLVCEHCVDRCTEACSQLTDQEVPAPHWLCVDEQCRYGVRLKPLRRCLKEHASLATAPPRMSMSLRFQPNPSLSPALTDITPIRKRRITSTGSSVWHQREWKDIFSKWELRALAPTSPEKGDSQVAETKPTKIPHKSSILVPSFASRDDAADIFSWNEHSSCWQKSGFGRPAPPSALQPVAPVDMVAHTLASSAFRSQSWTRLSAKLQLIASLHDDDRAARDEFPTLADDSWPWAPQTTPAS